MARLREVGEWFAATILLLKSMIFDIDGTFTDIKMIVDECNMTDFKFLFLVRTLHLSIFHFMHKKIFVTGILAPLFFWIIVFLGGLMNVHYTHLHNTISELGMKGAPAEKFMLIALLLLTILSLVFSLLFFKCCIYFNISVVPALLSFCMPLSILWAAIFPMGNYWHDKQGPLPLFLLLGMVAAFFFWPKREFYKERLWSGLAIVVLLLIFLRFVKPFGNEYEGLVQRFYYLGWTIWCISIGILFSKRLKNKNSRIVDK